MRSVAASFFASIASSWTCAGCNRSTKTSMCPPHARPTSNATSSATPKAASFGFPVLSTFWASSKTAPSMQPLETEPAILPDRVTTIFDPSGRGLEPHVSTTVASAISSPSRVHCSSSLKTSRIAYINCSGPLAFPGPPAACPGRRGLAGCWRRGSRRSEGAPPPYLLSKADSPWNRRAGSTR